MKMSPQLGRIVNGWTFGNNELASSEGFLVNQNFCCSSSMRTKGTSCSDGSKFVLKAGGGVRKQFLFTNGKIILAFVTNGEQFASCSSFTEVTSSVECKCDYKKRVKVEAT